jgi:hypothetical protein
MRKFIYSAVAAGALAFGGAASAQDIIGNVLGSILGNVGTTGAAPAVVAPGSYPYGTVYTDQYGRRVQVDQYGRHVVIDNNVYGNNVYGTQGSHGGRVAYDQYGRSIALDQFGTYRDSYGRRIQVDAYGRQVLLDQYGSYRDQHGRTVYLGANGQPQYVEQNGQLMAYSSTTVARRGDRDGDGVRNRVDRYPDDPRWY